MSKNVGLASLNLNATRPTGDGSQPLSPALSPQSPGSPPASRSNPGSPRLQGGQARFPHQLAPVGTQPMAIPQGQQGLGAASVSTSPQTAPSHGPPSPSTGSPRHGRDASKSFFSNLMASKSSHRLHSPDSGNREPVERSTIKSRASSKDRSLYALRPKKSTHELPKTAPTNPTTIDNTSNDQSRAQANSETVKAQQSANAKNRPRLGGILSRTKSIKVDDGPKYKSKSPSQLNLDPSLMQNAVNEGKFTETIKTAPIRSDHRDRAFAEETGSIMRNRSADRHLAAPRHDDTVSVRRDRQGGSLTVSHSFRDGAGLLSNLHQTGRGVGDRLGRAGKGFFGKITRSGSTNERELVNDDNYTCTVINLPLVKQTRKTRIARRLEISKDKTEFWMPALPWRCIDYLNMNGCEEEGLYRIPGSGREVKHWQRRFDTEYDINLFDEPELYDINTIGSMFKAWLRDLPDEILPKTVQARIAKECAGATKTPKMLKDELSKLPPFNYYLLFAITCHLSLLHSFADKNKMDYRNLCICFQPCLKIDGFVFQFLVQDWKSCWQGCWTEKEYLEEEYRYEKEGSIRGNVNGDTAVKANGNGNGNSNAIGSDENSADERAISSSGSSGQHVVPDARPSSQRKASLPRSVRRKASSSTALQANGGSTGQSTANTNGNADGNNTPDVPAIPRAVRTPEPQIVTASLPELKGLSPIKF